MSEQKRFEDIVKLVTIDKARGKRITIQLVDSEGEEISLRDTTDSLMSFLENKFQDETPEGNQVLNQVLPLCTQTLVSGLPRAVGEQRAAQMLGLEKSRTTLVLMMMLSFSLLKFIQQKGLKIMTVEEEITTDEMDKIQRMSEASEAATLAAMMGISPKEILQELVKEGSLSGDELSQMIGEDIPIPPKDPTKYN